MIIYILSSDVETCMMYIQDGFNDIQSSSRCRMYKEIKQVRA